MKKSNLLALLLLGIALITACGKDKDSAPSAPTATNVEIGLKHEKKGYVAQDFHFNADVRAGQRIDSVHIQILQRPSETYTGVWSLKLGWGEFKGLKNTNVHKHFPITSDAPLGNYDFIFTVTDENGLQLQLTETLTIRPHDEYPGSDH